ncbi:MAG: signal peptide peptidase SppA [Deltaproteobacteria bacterium]|nr:MAG: signal peptide peptidase SppA [Deltaproteobacteria bacterium]
MRLIDIVNGPWAIRPAMLEEIQRIYATHLRGEKIDIAKVEAATGKKLDNSRNGSYVLDQVAVIPMIGVIGKRMNLFTEISGGVSTEMIAKDFEQAVNDPAIKGIVLHIDSPGGTVDGTKQLADMIAGYRGTKPVLACADGMMCSAAYWIGSAADGINIADLTTDVGSIGVVAAHQDISGWEEKHGVKTTEITAGKYKRAISQYQPLSEEGRAMIQADLDQIYELFVDAVAGNRGKSVDAVLSEMAEGRVFLGRKAVEAGLVDGVATLAETINQVLDLSRAAQPTSRRAGVATPTKEKKTMNLEKLKADHPELVEAIVAEAQAGMAEAVATARTEGAESERQRIADVRAQSIPGHEALIEQLAFDGKSTGADAALAIVAAEKEARTTASAAADADAPQAVDAVDAGDGAAKTMKRKEFNALDQQARRAFFAAGGKLID